ncbi:MAG: hypothetical protein PHY31_05035, partial [Smithellaceae bacterium]|nr:hypothetical protein [Smithellaceae bacterium]
QQVKVALPAHGKAIFKLQSRLESLERHHRHRLHLTYDACRHPRSIWQIATMSRYFDVYVDPAKFNPLAGQEAAVHVELLQMVGAVTLSRVEGVVHYFQSSGEDFEIVYKRVEELIADESKTLLMRR